MNARVKARLIREAKAMLVPYAVDQLRLTGEVEPLDVTCVITLSVRDSLARFVFEDTFFMRETGELLQTTIRLGWDWDAQRAQGS